MTRIFHTIIFVKMDSMSGCDIRLVFTFPPKDNTLQFKNVHTSEITFLALVPWAGGFENRSQTEKTVWLGIRHPLGRVGTRKCSIWGYQHHLGLLTTYIESH